MGRVDIHQAEFDSVVAEASGRALEASSEPLLEQMREECPVDTGRLRDSLRVEMDGEGAYVGSDLDYAIHVEEGSRRTPPNAFMRRALASLQGYLQGLWG